MKGPRALFQSLKQGDPQAIAVMSVLVFVLSVGWFSWSTYGPSAQEDFNPVGGGRPRPPVPTATPLSTFIEAQQKFQTGEDPVNPFHLPWSPPTPRPPRERTPRENTDSGNSQNRNNDNRPDQATQDKPPRAPAATPTPKPTPIPRVTYVYKGTITRPDGGTVALVVNAKNGSSHFVSVDGTLPPLTVRSITPDILESTHPDGTLVRMPRGEPHTFEVPR